VNPENNPYSQLKTSSIMLVDDEPVMLEIVQALLEEEGYRNFVAVENSTQAVATLIETNPDLLLLDLDMPQVDGFQILQAVRELDDFIHLPIIMMTASEQPADKLKALELGATDFLSKPVDPSELALRVRNTLSAKAYQDHLAYYDNLTGLPNRLLFLNQLEKGIRHAQRDERPLVLLDIGLDHFRNINETLGVHYGDQILQTVARRLTQVLRASDIIGRNEAELQIETSARTGGDEFSVILLGANSVENALIVSDRLLQSIKQPFTLDGKDIHLTASIGISVAPGDGNDADTLFKHAVSAKDFAKKHGKNRYQFYSSEMEAQSRAIMQMSSDLRIALDNNQFELYYQPQVDAVSGRIVGMESLLRWVHPENGPVSPLDFIPVAEEMGLIVEMGDWVLRQACHTASEWNAAGDNDLKVSVNVSAKQFKDPGFTKSIESALFASRLDPRNLVLEITESMLMSHTEHLVNLLREIESLGIRFSLDDFGTGYSSLSYLKRFPISELKIDRSFLREVPAKQDDNAIVRAIIAMAHSLGQSVVAEGVEEIEQIEFLRQHDCDIFQGYYYSKALSQSDFSDYLASQKKPLPQVQSTGQ